MRSSKPLTIAETDRLYLRHMSTEALLAGYRGQSYARQATMATVAYGFGTLELKRIVAGPVCLLALSPSDL